ncbi:hypothetical protein JCM10213_006367 [Rhodosporidiobolus nylandii]
MAGSVYPPRSRAAYEPVGDDLEAQDGAREAADEGLAWQHPQARKSRRWDWRTGLAGLLAGVVLGAGAVHTTGRVRAANEPAKAADDLVLLPSASISSPSNASDALSVPVRIHYRGENGLNGRDAILPPDCPVGVVYTSDENSADVVVLNSDSHQSISVEELEERNRKRPWQKHAIWGVEAAPNRQSLESHFHRLRDGKRNETVEYEMTYRLNSTVPATYSYGYFNYDNPPLPVQQKRSDKIAAAFISNCNPKNARTLLLDELSALLPGKIDSFGSCRNNANTAETLREMGLYDSVGEHSRWNEKITMIGHYRFTIAFENSNDLDYATEKYFQALERGSVPIVFGPPHYAARLFPSPNAAIDVAEYLPQNYTALSTSSSTAPTSLDADAKEGLARLAKRLEHLSSEEGTQEYEEMLAWKKSSWRDDTLNPLGKIVRESTSRWAQDCRLAGVYRGQEWARSKWTEP